MGARIIRARHESALSGWQGSLLPYGEFLLALIAGGLWYTQGGAVWYEGVWPGPWPLFLLALAALSRLWRAGLPRRTAMDLSLWLFVASAGVGVWAAYNRGPAWAVFWLIVGAVGLYYAIASQPDDSHRLVILAFWGLAGAGLSLFFLATHDWAAEPSKSAFLAQWGRRIQGLLPSLPGHRLSSNVAGGLLAMLLPLYVPLLAVARTAPHVERPDFSRGLRRPWARGWFLFWLVAAGVAGLGLVISMSRGAWVGLLVAAGLWSFWRGLGRWSRKQMAGDSQGDALRPRSIEAWRWRVRVMGAVLAVGMVAAWGLSALVLARQWPGSGALANRLSLFRDALLLARDYPFLGTGLGMFQIQFSIYTLLIHVGYIVYSHNILLSILTAQGLLGLVPYLALLISTVVLAGRRLRELQGQAGSSAYGVEAAVASLAVLLVHGMVDDVLYGSRGALLLFLPCALVTSFSLPGRRAGIPECESQARRVATRAAWAVVALVTVLLFGARPLLGAWYSNLGAIEQARAELSVYDPDHFDVTMDEVRQELDLERPRRLLTRAKEIDPRNLTARQRLASIDLSLRRYPEALAEMQAAWDTGGRDRVTRLLYGDALVASGQPERAAEVVRGLSWAETRLDLQAWARYWENSDYRRAADAWAAVSLLNPANKPAADARAEAEKRLKTAQ